MKCLVLKSRNGYISVVHDELKFLHFMLCTWETAGAGCRWLLLCIATQITSI